jgi:hypothetical protein
MHSTLVTFAVKEQSDQENGERARHGEDGFPHREDHYEDERYHHDAYPQRQQRERILASLKLMSDPGFGG